MCQTNTHTHTGSVGVHSTKCALQVPCEEKQQWDVSVSYVLYCQNYVLFIQTDGEGGAYS